MNNTRQQTAERILDGLRQYYGTENYFQHPLKKCVCYTDGVAYLAKEAKAHWLVDAIASYYVCPLMRAAMRKDARLREMHFWELKLDKDDCNKAVLTSVADSGCKPFIEQRIPYTDFPLDEIRIWSAWDGFRWVLYLPSEH